jgi:hypothetical protein
MGEHRLLQDLSPGDRFVLVSPGRTGPEGVSIVLKHDDHFLHPPNGYIRVGEELTGKIYGIEWEFGTYDWAERAGDAEIISMNPSSVVKTDDIRTEEGEQDMTDGNDSPIRAFVDRVGANIKEGAVNGVGATGADILNLAAERTLIKAHGGERPEFMDSSLYEYMGPLMAAVMTHGLLVSPMISLVPDNVKNIAENSVDAMEKGATTVAVHRMGEHLLTFAQELTKLTSGEPTPPDSPQTD